MREEVKDAEPRGQAGLKLVPKVFFAFYQPRAFLITSLALLDQDSAHDVKILAIGLAPVLPLETHVMGYFRRSNRVDLGV